MATQSSAFDRLHERVRRWVWEQNWTELRDAQEAAIAPILAATDDVIISAATAGGKTEAAFLPICSHLLEHAGRGVRVLYVSPLKALINDQFRRLEQVCEGMEIPVHRWHGDVAASAKQRLLRHPSGVLLITPESLEALLVLHGPSVAHLLGGLAYVVVDELHSFIGAERGRQLQSLLHRVEATIDRRVPRVGLSATLGDMTLAATFLRPGQGDAVKLIISAEGGQELRLQVRGYRTAATSSTAEDDQDQPSPEEIAICEHLYATLRGSQNLIFANSRRDVEAHADRLRGLCERRHVPNEFWPHHGSLSRPLRADVEAMLKDPARPVSVVCTTTLEMGIDIGDMASIAQIGAPPAVAAMRQRLGRSGRRGGPAVLRIYVREPALTEHSALTDALRVELVQAVAMVRLLAAGWYEPPPHGALHLSTLVQQVLALIAERGGVHPLEAWRLLCERGPFAGVDQALFGAFLRGLAGQELIVQASDSTLLLGPRGERIVNHYSFYTAFITAEEYRIVTEGRALGTLPISYPIAEESLLIFAGRRWRVTAVDAERRVIDVLPAAGGRPPIFAGSGPLVHDRVREEMLAVYTSTETPAFLDVTARDLLEEARSCFARHDLATHALVASGEETLLFPWRGDRVINTLAVQLRARGLRIAVEGVALAVAGISPRQLADRLAALVREGPADGRALAATVRTKLVEKYDGSLTEDLLCADYASRALDPEGAWRALSEMLRRGTLRP